jgi:hypothetical protein
MENVAQCNCRRVEWTESVIIERHPETKDIVINLKRNCCNK